MHLPTNIAMGRGYIPNNFFDSNTGYDSVLLLRPKTEMVSVLFKMENDNNSLGFYKLQLNITTNTLTKKLGLSSNKLKK